MSAPTTLAAFAVALAAAFAGAAGIGNAVGPVTSPPAATHDAGRAAGHDAAQPAPGGHDEAAPVPAGLSSTQDGYRLVLERAALPLGARTELGLRVLGPDGGPVTQVTPSHGEAVHLVLVRRDGSGFQHLHPRAAGDGSWSAAVTLPSAGSWKAVVETVPRGRTDAVVLASDLVVAGELRPAPPLPKGSAAVDGYEVTLSGHLVAGRPSRVTLGIRRDGRPVTDLQPYLAAYGHLVALREGDLAYLHTHPDGAPSPGPDVPFVVDVPSAGTYQLHLGFRHGGVVRTVSLSATATS